MSNFFANVCVRSFLIYNLGGKNLRGKNLREQNFREQISPPRQSALQAKTAAASNWISSSGGTTRKHQSRSDQNCGNAQKTSKNQQKQKTWILCRGC